MVSPSRCPPWQPERPGPTRREPRRAQRSYTTRRDTIFVGDHAAEGATVYTDDHQSYGGLSFEHEAVKHSVSEYVRDQVHTNGIESFWAALKRGYHGTFHHISEKAHKPLCR